MGDIFTPNLCDTNWRSLNASQNAALIIATGNVVMADAGHLQAETKVLPVRDHCELLSRQFLLRTQLPDHPNHRTLDKPRRYRKMKNTLRSEYRDDIQNLIPEGGLDQTSFKNGLKTLHTRAVRNSIGNRKHSKVLHRPAPDTNPEELTFPRRTRRTLTQLRSGYSSMLNTYLAIIRPNTQVTCPDCHTAPHTTQHLFECPVRPTNLTPEDLWKQPRKVAQFLQLDLDEGLDESNDDPGGGPQ